MFGSYANEAPPATVFGGHLRHFTGDILGFFCRCERDFGPVVPLRLYAFPIYLVNDPEIIAEVLIRQNEKFEKGLAIQILKPMFGEGLLSAEHETWRRQRVLLQPAFRREAIARYTKSMVESAQTLLDSWTDGSVRNIHDDMVSLTLDIVVRCLFGADESIGRAAVIAGARAVQEFFGKYRRTYLALPPVVPTPANLLLRRNAKRMDEMIFRMIAARRASKNRGDDVLSLLLDIRGEDGSASSDQQIRDELVTLFLAGTETTAGALAWALYLLSRNPDVRSEFFREVDTVLGGTRVCADDLPRLPYTEKLFKEVLRLYPTSHVFGRVAKQACTVGKYRVRRGDNLLISQWAIQRSARHYDHPEQFRPERWTAEMTANLHKFAYLPFGGGPRSCIGANFATTEAKLILVTIAQRFIVDCVAGTDVRPDPAVTLRPAGGLPMLVRTRGT